MVKNECIQLPFRPVENQMTHPKSAMSKPRVNCYSCLPPHRPHVSLHFVPTLFFSCAISCGFFIFLISSPTTNKWRPKQQKNTSAATQGCPKKHPNLPGGFLRGGFQRFFFFFFGIFTWILRERIQFDLPPPKIDIYRT